MYKSIAIDGPSGAGKSTISKIIADKIGFFYLDTGAMYRSYTYYYIKNCYDIKNEELVNSKLKDITLMIKDGKFLLNGQDVNKEIRSQEVTSKVSLISSYRLVREKLVEEQRHLASTNNSVLDGRDIGSTVLPNASIKFYLDAKAEIRAERRLQQLNRTDITHDEVLADIIRRDKYDSSRSISPLKKADDAIVIDTSNLDIDEVVNLMLKKLEEKNVI